MLLSSKGVVIQSIKYGENSLISKIISEEKGLVSVISTRSKSKKNKQGNYFQPLSAIHFVAYLSNKSTLFRIKEITFNKAIQAQEDVVISSIRFFLAEILGKVVKEEEQNFQLYQFIEKELINLYSKEADRATFPLNFLIRFMNILGIQPDINPKDLYFDYYEGCTTNSKPNHFEYSERNNFIALSKYITSNIKPSKLERKQLVNLLLCYYNVQLSAGLENLKSKAVLEVVLS